MKPETPISKKESKKISICTVSRNGQTVHNKVYKNNRVDLRIRKPQGRSYRRKRAGRMEERVLQDWEGQTQTTHRGGWLLWRETHRGSWHQAYG